MRDDNRHPTTRILSNNETDPHDLDHADTFFSMVRSIDLQLQICGDSEEQRPRQSVWNLNKWTTVGDWVSGLVAVTACAGRERAGSLQPVSAGMKCKGQASSLCKRPGYIQGRQKPACVVTPPLTPPAWCDGPGAGAGSRLAQQSQCGESFSASGGQRLTDDEGDAHEEEDHSEHQAADS